jgi:heme A synthase
MTASISDTIAKPRLHVEQLARVCVALMGVVVIASAFLRLHGANAALASAWADELGLARAVHRIAATLVLLGALVMWWLARRDGRARALVAVGLALSVLGVVAGASRAAPVVVLNLIGGLAMLALCAALATPLPHAAAPTQAADGGTRSIARALLAVVFVQAAGGAWASATASADCGFVAGCGALPLAHRTAGVLIASTLIVFGARIAWREGRVSAAALALLAFLSLLVGLLGAGLGTAGMPVLAVVHNALAAATVVTLVRLG